MMVRAGYKRDTCTGLIAAGNILSPIMPPSVPMIIFGVQAGVSVTKLFMGGIAPAVYLSGALCVLWFFIAKKDNLAKAERQSAKQVAKALLDGLWALILPVFILVGLRSGKFTSDRGWSYRSGICISDRTFCIQRIKNQYADGLSGFSSKVFIGDHVSCSGSHGVVLDDDSCKCSIYRHRYSGTVYRASNGINVNYLSDCAFGWNIHGCNAYHYDPDTCIAAGSESSRNRCCIFWSGIYFNDGFRFTYTTGRNSIKCCLRRRKNQHGENGKIDMAVPSG